MDGCSSFWLPFQSGVVGDGGGAGAASSERSCFSELQLQQEPDLPLTTQVDEQLEQIYLLMDMEEHGPAEAPSSQSSTFGWSPGGGTSSTTLMPGSCSTSNSWHHAPEVSSLNTPLSTAVTYGDRLHDHCYYGMAPNLEEFTCQEDRARDQEQERAQRKASGHGGAFRPYSRHLSPKKKPKPGTGGGQRAIKTAMSTLARMHMDMVRLAHHREMENRAVTAPLTTGRNSGDQLQHVLSERRRREKLNDSFKALKAVLPPAPKKDKASILMRARDYVNTLRSRVSELEERNRMLEEVQHRRNNGGDQEDVSGENTEVDTDRAEAEKTSQEFHLNVAVRPGCSGMDAVVGVLECLKEMGDVRLAVMNTDGRATTLTLQKKDSVIKSVRGAMQSKIETS